MKSTLDLSLGSDEVPVVPSLPAKKDDEMAGIEDIAMNVEDTCFDTYAETSSAPGRRGVTEKDHEVPAKKPRTAATDSDPLSTYFARLSRGKKGETQPATVAVNFDAGAMKAMADMADRLKKEQPTTAPLDGDFVVVLRNSMQKGAGHFASMSRAALFPGTIVHFNCEALLRRLVPPCDKTLWALSAQSFVSVIFSSFSLFSFAVRCCSALASHCRFRSC